MSTNKINFTDLPALREPLEGGTFAGLTPLADGRHCAVVLLHERPEKRLTWQEAKDWARSVGGHLVSPDIVLLIHATCPDLVPQAWVWTDKPEGSSYAWFCSFLNGDVRCTYRSADGGAVAVRLLEVVPGYEPRREDSDAQPQPGGEVVVTWDESRTRILAVTRQDEEGRVLKLIAQAPPQP